jgi:hypothetical protein
MGMYTSVMSSDIEIMRPVQLKEWLMDKKVPVYVKMKGMRGSAPRTDDCSTEYVCWTETLLKERDTEMDIPYEFFNERKIIGYWYPGFLMFIRDLAQFVEGEVELQYEDGRSYAKIIFKDKDCKIAHGELSYDEPEPLDLMPLPHHEQLQRKL